MNSASPQVTSGSSSPAIQHRTGRWQLPHPRGCVQAGGEQAAAQREGGHPEPRIGRVGHDPGGPFAGPLAPGALGRGQVLAVAAEQPHRIADQPLTSPGPLQVEQPEPVDGIVAGKRPQEGDAVAVGADSEAARLAEGEAARAGVLAGESVRTGHRAQITASSRTTAAAAQTTATPIHSDAWIQVGRESANTRNPAVKARYDSH